MVSTVWSVSCLLFYTHGAPPPYPAICKSGIRAPVPYEVGATGRLRSDDYECRTADKQNEKFQVRGGQKIIKCRIGSKRTDLYAVVEFQSCVFSTAHENNRNDALYKRKCILHIYIYRVVQKTDTQFYFWDNFSNSAPILTTLSLLQAKVYGM